MKKRLDINLKHWLINKLRRFSYQWQPRKEAIKKARVSRGKYICASCEGIFGPREIQADHKEPVIDPHDGFVDWNTYIERLFCDVDNYQILCKGCHQTKSFFETEIRKQVKFDKDDDI